MRKALVVGINHYEHLSGLHGCVNDALSVKNILDRNFDGTFNFDVKPLTSSEQAEPITRHRLRENLRELFADDNEIALFYFAGHGYIEPAGGYLLTSDSITGDDGVPLSDVLGFANTSKAKNKIIILDSCHSGIAGTPTSFSKNADLSEGLTILTASTAEQYANEEDGTGIFTSLLVDGLNGAAGNIVGEVTPGSVYAHIDQSLGAWEQRPVFKTNVKSFVSLRTVKPAIDINELRRITEFFPSPGFIFDLDPTYEPERPNPNADIVAPDPVHTQIFAILQKYNRINLLVPIDVTHMYHAAMESKSCKLTALGEHYRRLVDRGRI